MPYSNSTESECNCIMVDIMRNIQDSVCVHSIAQGAHCMLCRCVIHLAWCRLWLHNSTHCCLCLQDQHQYNVSHIRQSADFDSFVQHKWQLAKQKNKKRTRSSKYEKQEFFIHRIVANALSGMHIQPQCECYLHKYHLLGQRLNNSAVSIPCSSQVSMCFA